MSTTLPYNYDFISQDETTDENINHFIKRTLITYEGNHNLKEFWNSILILNNQYEEAEISSKETINILIDTMLDMKIHTEEEIVSSLRLFLYKD